MTDSKRTLRSFKERYEEHSLYEQMIQEVLSKDADAGAWIDDFVKSDNPKFKGKSKDQRKKMALAAYYAKQRNEEVVVEGEEERKQNALWAQITHHEKSAKATKNDIKKQHHMNMANQLRGQLKTNEEVELEEGLKDTLKTVAKKAVKALAGPDDEGHRKDLQRKMGIPQTGKPGHAAQNEEVVEEGWDDMLKAVKARSGPQPSGGSGVKKGTRYGGGKQTTKPEHEDEPKKKVNEAKRPEQDNVPFVTNENKPLTVAKDLAKKSMRRLKGEMLGKISN